MSDAKYRQLQRMYCAAPSDELLFQLNAYAVRQGLADLPANLEEVEAIEELSWGGVPLLAAALANCYQDQGERNLMYHLVGALGRQGDISVVPLLNTVADYFFENEDYYKTMTKGIRSIITWLEIKAAYRFGENTTAWDVITASPLLDYIHIIPSNAGGYPSGSMYDVWNELREMGHYTLSVYREGSFSPIWRASVPGYGSGDSGLITALGSGLHSIINTKYKGMFPGARDSAPLERWPKTIALVITAQAVEMLQGDDWVGRAGPSYNFLFLIPEQVSINMLGIGSPAWNTRVSQQPEIVLPR